MQERVMIDVSVGAQNRTDWRSISRSLLEPLHPAEVKEGVYGAEYTFDYYPEQAPALREQLRAVGISSSIWVHRLYVPKELLSAEYLMLSYEYNVESEDRALRKQQSALCSYCHFQEVRWNLNDSDIPTEVGQYQVASVDWGPEVITTKLADVFVAAGYSGMTLVPVGRHEPAAWYGLGSDHVLPPLQVPPTRLLISPRPTPFCRYDHALALPDSEMFYRRDTFSAKDFNHSYEYYGESGSGSRVTIISNRVYRLMVELGVKGLRCEPIRFVD